ncbi:hypothetical protein CPT_Muldoon_074 [Serratia phage Muldoon]|uniref:Uncharacterized protein n=1 Tax=Serratia phage Muldoon TaxID=2601678 RepID=A0A5P8PJ01_9CAUD|nr:hypothetical protein HYP94_gp073 [Serratia phage Muldoon]QFR56030.1 hypothetical protein CPT_Muldoon_074 [Serratia phage Muldoon]
MTEQRPAHIERVMTELSELNGKIIALDAFINGKVFIQLHEIDQQLLEQQLAAMRSYAFILKQRLMRAS